MPQPTDSSATPEATPANRPPMAPDSDEADAKQLALAKQQGDALQAALDYMINNVAHDGRKTHAGDYIIGVAVEEAEGMYVYDTGEFKWMEPGDKNLHVEVAVCDGADGRFVPGADVRVTLIQEETGKSIGTQTQPLLWHPMLLHYGLNWTVPGDGKYTIKVHVEPPRFSRHDEKNGKRYCEPADVIFEGINVKTGQD